MFHRWATLCLLGRSVIYYTSFVKERKLGMETRIAVIAIIVEKSESTRELNDVLHEYCEHIIGRMGIPYRSRGVNIISVAVDAPNDIINALSGKIGRIQGVTTKTAYSNVGA